MIGQPFRIRRGVAQRLAQPRDSVIDGLSTTLDQAVGVEEQCFAFGEAVCDLVWGPAAHHADGERVL